MVRKSEGSLIDFMTVMLTILAMVAVMVVFFNLSGLLIVRMDVSQTTRKYILRMETKGYLDAEDKEDLMEELAELGLKEIDLSGSTLAPVSYGDSIVLWVKGSLVGSAAEEGEGWPYEFIQRKYDVEEKRMSTAKN